MGKEMLCTVDFPPTIVVSGPRERLSKTQTTGGKPMAEYGERAVLKDVPLKKALKFARSADAKVTDSDGTILAKPTVDVTDRREAASAGRTDALVTENASLLARLEVLEAKVDQKADRPGPKAGSRK